MRMHWPEHDTEDPRVCAYYWTTGLLDGCERCTAHREAASDAIHGRGAVRRERRERERREEAGS